MRKVKVGLALGCGAWRGLAHIGVIKTFEEQGIPINYIAGSSAGALFGGLYAGLGDIGEVEKIVRQLGYRDLLRRIFDPKLRAGFLKGQKALRFLHEILGDKKIEDATIPFAAVATDLLTAQTVALREGDLGTAIRASCSVPVIFEPVVWGKHLLVDGGASMPVPVKVVREMGADVVVAVFLEKDLFPISKRIGYRFKKTKLSMLRLTMQIVIHHLSGYDLQEADLVIAPDIPEGRSSIFLKFIGNQQTIDSGAAAAEAAVEKIKKLIKEEERSIG